MALQSPTVTSDQFKSYLSELRSKSIQQLAGSTLNALIYGPKGIGKTELLTTCPTPVVVHSFDPGGCKHLRPEIEAGKILYDDRFEMDDPKAPTAWNLWEDTFRGMLAAGTFNDVGTYCIDSLTTMTQALYALLATGKTKKGTELASDGVLEIKGWNILTTTLADMIKMATALPCHVILNAHNTKDKEEVSGKMYISLAASPAARVRIPMLFDEYYYMQVDPKDDSKRVLQTANTDKIIAGTRLGRSKFDRYERPDIGALMKKAGMEVSDVT